MAPIGDVERAEQIATESYESLSRIISSPSSPTPTCVFAEENLDEIPVIFNGKYDLSLLYPNRKRFHFTEAVGFMGVMGYYFMKKGDIEQAQTYHKILK